MTWLQLLAHPAFLAVEAALFVAVCWLINRDIHLRQSAVTAIAHGAVTCTATACALLYLGGIR